MRQRARSAWLFLAPMLIVLAAVAGWPLVRTIYFSFTDASLADLEARRWVGFTNYFSVLQMPSGRVIYDGLLVDPIWWRAVWNTVRFTLISVTCETILGMIVALVLNAEFRGRGIVRAAILIPWATPTIVSAKMWQWMLNDQFGIINDILLRLGLIDTKIAWTASADTAMFAVLIVDIWKTTPFMALLILAALQMLPKEIFEVARLDGVSPLKIFWRVTLPLIRPALMVAVIFRAIDALRVFDVIYVLTGANEQSMTMSIYARQQLFEFNQAGYGSAVSTLLFFIVALATILLLLVSRVRLGGD
jgi:trehalose/maltose transport system permease protein